MPVTGAFCPPDRNGTDFTLHTSSEDCEMKNTTSDGASDSHKKFKRKAREPRRLFHSPDEGEESLPGSAFTHLDIPHWPTAISQPLCGRLRVGPRAGHPELCFRPLGHFRPHEEEEERESSSPQECQRLRPAPDARGHAPDARGHAPEVKAIQQTRRLLANARERTRVHTISAAFEALRKQVPCYSYGQKLSKLAILRIACNYILSLAQLAEPDPASEHRRRSFSRCVEQCTRTLQAEGRNKKKKVQ